MADQTVDERRNRIATGAADLLQDSRDKAREAANQLADLTGHERTIESANRIAGELDYLLSMLAGREIMLGIEREEVRRGQADAAAQADRERQTLECLDDSRSEYEVDAADRGAL